MSLDDKITEHAGIMARALRLSSTPVLPENLLLTNYLPAAAPWQKHIDALVAWFKARWPEQVHMRAAFIENPTFFIGKPNSRCDDDAVHLRIQTEILKLDDGYGRPECLPRVERVVAGKWLKAARLTTETLQDFPILTIPNWQDRAVELLCEEVREDFTKIAQTVSLEQPRLFWRKLPEVDSHYRLDEDAHIIWLRFRCQIEGSDWRGTPEGAGPQYIRLLYHPDGTITCA